MISPRRLGVHARSRTAAPSAGLIHGWTRKAGVRLVTLAPEVPGAGAVIRALVGRGVVVAAGHSDATYDEARRAFARGVAAGTHLFNAMSGPDRREPGLAGALLEASGVRAGIIADGLHVHPAMVRLAWEMKGGPAGIVLVSDAAPIAGRSGPAGGCGDREASRARRTGGSRGASCCSTARCGTSWRSRGAIPPTRRWRPARRPRRCWACAIAGRSGRARART